MRVLIARSNPVDPDPRVEKTARALTADGMRVTILAWDRSGSRPGIGRLRCGAAIHRLAIKARFGRGLWNLPHLIRWQIGLTAWLSGHREEYDVIHACDFDTVLPALLCRRLWHKKVVYDIFDFYADMLRATPPFVMRLIRVADLKAINHVDRVILADEARRDQIRGSRPKQVIAIYNTPEDYLSGGLDGSTGRDGQDLFRVAFVGLLQLERGLLQLLEVLGRHPEWRLDLAGFGGDADLIRRKAHALPNVLDHGRIPYDRGIELSSTADVLVATYDPGNLNHRYASPNKLFEAMMLARPIVVAEGTNMDRIVREHGCGLVVPYGDIDALEQCLLTLASNPELRKQLGVAGRRAYESKYSWSIMKERLLELYRGL